MIVRVLGSAAGGGVPQWNCACKNCTAARVGHGAVTEQRRPAVRQINESLDIGLFRTFGTMGASS